MSVILSKMKTYIGFATKSNSIKFGTDNILKAKHSKIILVSDEIADNSYQKVTVFAKKLGIEIAKRICYNLNSLNIQGVYYGSNLQIKRYSWFISTKIP